MEQQVMNIRRLTLQDYDALHAMQTGIEDDYVVRIFDRLVTSDVHELFGLFRNGHMLSVGGYSLFAEGRFAMLGRLRSDHRYLGQGMATELLSPIIEDLKQRPEVAWIGANTHVHNSSARRVLEKIGVQQGPQLHYLILTEPDKLNATPGAVWEPVQELTKKRALLRSLHQNALGVFPYECYYPFPFDDALFTDAYLQTCSFYQSPDQQRFVVIQNDQKKYQYAHVKYFWNDHYEQPGFFETLRDHWQHNPDNVGCWIDFSPEGYQNIQDLTPYEVKDPWVLYGMLKQA
ncbi:GNAT family N-acetyltransferase [Thalassobacillus sp. CUG 92003]|uniref:GNAT family N-acetyltransferase n=1 Tax=Thalassobacillus sp. CUG 92003 TaxID=2736641 RepID=UPI0015E65334|nr:GNAT family N-acetyltransferase [Thalassobacillus sp. CUG 92003]